jgi:hypothetical protein
MEKYLHDMDDLLDLLLAALAETGLDVVTAAACGNGIAQRVDAAE